MDTKKKRRVVITGLGTVNPTGNTVAESWANIKAGRCAVGPITTFDTADFKVKLAARNSVFLNYKNMPLFQRGLNFPAIKVGQAIKARFFEKRNIMLKG